MAFKNFVLGVYENLTDWIFDCDLDQYEDVFNLITRAERIFFVSVGKNKPICEKVSKTAGSFGLQWFPQDANELGHGDLGYIKENDLIIFLSKSGNTKELINARNFLSNNTIILMTIDGGNLENVCDYTIKLPAEDEGSPFGLAPMTSSIMFLVWLEATLCEVVKRKNITLKDYAKSHPQGAIGQKIKNEKRKNK